MTVATIIVVGFGIVAALSFGLFLVTVRKTNRLEMLLEDVLSESGMSPFEIRAILNGDAVVHIDRGGRG